MKIILHIGADKCGSTAIQKTLYHNAEKLRERKIAYLAGEFILAHDGTICRMEGSQRVIDGGKLRERLEIASSRNSEVLIFSFEGFHTVSQQSLREVREILGEHEVQIVYYIREQADYVNSALLQRAKTKYEAENALRVHRGEWDGFLGHNYAGILWTWRQAFPGSEISVRVFDREELVGGDVVMDFFDCIGVAMDGLKVDESVVNTSITLETAVALETMAALGLVEKDRGSVAIGVGAGVGGCKKLISRGHSWVVRLRNLRCNISLARRYFGRLLPFRYKAMRREKFEKGRVLDILQQTGAYLSHVPVGEDFELRKEAVSFLSQGFVMDEAGVVLNEGHNKILLRCGNWHAAELWNGMTITFEFDQPASEISVGIWGQKKSVAEDGKVEFSIRLAETTILVPATATIDCEGQINRLMAIGIDFH